jgi:hypothetical protein
MSKTPSLFPGVSFEDAVIEITALSEPAFRALKAAVGSPRAFDDDADRVSELARDLGVSAHEVFMLLQASSILYERVRALPDGASAPEAIGRFIDEFDEEVDPDVKTILAARLIELTSVNENVELNKKIRRLQAGFLDTAYGFATFVDLRPDFTANRDTVRGFVPMIQIRISTNADNPDHQSLLFQVDEIGLSKLKEEIEAVEKKLSTLSKSNLTSVPILFKSGRK